MVTLISSKSRVYLQGSRCDQSVGESIGGISEMGSDHWSNGVRYQIFDTRPDNLFKIFSNAAPAYRVMPGSAIDLFRYITDAPAPMTSVADSEKTLF